MTWKWANSIATEPPDINVVLVDEETGEGIVFHSAQWDVDEEHRSLIEAAPDLLEACFVGVLALEAWKDYDPDGFDGGDEQALDQLQAAIRKAKVDA